MPTLFCSAGTAVLVSWFLWIGVVRVQVVVAVVLLVVRVHSVVLLVVGVLVVVALLASCFAVPGRCLPPAMMLFLRSLCVLVQAVVAFVAVDVDLVLEIFSVWCR